MEVTKQSSVASTKPERRATGSARVGSVQEATAVRQKFLVWLLALLPILAVIGLGAGALATELGSASLLVTLPVVAIVSVVFGKAMARSVFGRRDA